MASDTGASVIITTKLRHGDSNTIMAEGGIQAASQECDSPFYHYMDTIGGGHFANQPDLAAVLRVGAVVEVDLVLVQVVGGQRREVADLVDVLGSDHAPHTLDEKAGSYPATPSGMPGLTASR